MFYFKFFEVSPVSGNIVYIMQSMKLPPSQGTLPFFVKNLYSETTKLFSAVIYSNTLGDATRRTGLRCVP